MSNNLISKVFNWFGIGLFVTFLVAYGASGSEVVLSFIFSGSGYLVICLLEIICAIWLSFRIYKMSSKTATILYLGYAALTGLTFSSIFIAYQITSIIFVFLATSLIFFIFAFIGKNTKINLNGIGIYLLVALFSVILLEIINLFLVNGTLDMILCVISIIIFVLYVAYDMQKICRLSDYDGVNRENVAIIGAFNIYLDFINLFIRLLRLFGKDRD